MEQQDQVKPMQNSPCRIGVVSYLNAKPLITGLEQDETLRLTFDVPARLPALLDRGEVDAALVPVIDLIQPGRSWQIISDACIGCDGETLTVRIFSRIPPRDIHELYVDGDSHTSVALAQVIWQRQFDRRLVVKPWQPERANDADAVLLIGDKVVHQRFQQFDLQTDLGGAWKSLTGLPFVFAAWATSTAVEFPGLAEKLNTARDRGVATAPQIAADFGPHLGWPVELARRYLTQRLRFTLTDRHHEGLRLFHQSVEEFNLVPGLQELFVG